METPNPLAAQANSSPPSSVSSTTFHIAGILTIVHGLEELSPTARSISCLWLHHPRLQTKEIMASIASKCINDWNSKPSADNNIGLIAVSFDQRNHGTREVSDLANQTWKKGNPSHAQDMFRSVANVRGAFKHGTDLISIFHGTAMDTSLLIDHLGSYVFHGPDEPEIDEHLVLGVSLGGHSAWQTVLADERVTAAVVVIGCPDYMRLISGRAKNSKLPTFGPHFLGSKDFPKSLVSSVIKWDPRGVFFGQNEITPRIQDKQRTLLNAKLRGKKILVCSGGDDKLVPYHCAEPFLNWLKETQKDFDISVEDIVYQKTGHTFSEDMQEDAVRFVSDVLAEKARKGPNSKI